MVAKEEDSWIGTSISRVAVLFIAELSCALGISMIYAALPTLREHFNSTIGVGWVVTACMLV